MFMRRSLAGRLPMQHHRFERVVQITLAAAAVALAVGMVQPLTDPDTFWHIAAGRHLLETGSFAGPDPWSATASHPWVLHEWLPEVVMAAAEQVGGPRAVAWLLPLGVVVLAATLYLVCRRFTAPVLAGLITVLAVGGMGGSLSLRPHLVTFALTAVAGAAWLATIRDGRARWWLIPLTWVWAASHGMWFVSVAIGSAAVVGLWLTPLLRRDVKGTDDTQGADSADATVRLSVRQLGRLALVPLGCLLAAMVTPVGPGLVTAPFTVREYARFVSEWRAPRLTDPWLQIYLAMLALLLLTWVLRAWRGRRQGVDRRVDWARIGLLCASIGASLVYVRTIAVGVALLVPLLAEASSHWGVRRGAGRPDRAEVTILISAVVIGLAASAVGSARIQQQVRTMPTSLNPALSAIPAGTVICNDYAQGGWLVWAHPNLRPTVDGRTEIYTPAHIEEYLNFAGAGNNWHAFVERTGCTYALLVPKSTPLARLQSEYHWTVVGTSPEAVLIRAPG